MKALVAYDGSCWKVSIESVFSDDPSGTFPLPELKSNDNKRIVVTAAALLIASRCQPIPPSLFDHKHWRVAGPRKWQFKGERPRIV